MLITILFQSGCSPKLVLLCNVVKIVTVDRLWLSIVSGAGMKEQEPRDDAVRMPPSLYVRPPRGLWLIKCG